MSKAILVIDIPDTCYECPLCATWDVLPSIEEYYCTVKNTEVDRYKKPDWCPLKSVPEKMEGYDSIKWQWGDYEDGWNHCIDSLIGE